MASETQLESARGSTPQMMLSFSLASEEEAPRRARKAIAALDPALPAPVLHDLGVVITELVANAVRFASPTPIGVAIEVQADESVFGEVVDGGIGGAVLDRARPLDEGGLGLQMVDALCSDWGVERRPSRVWFELDPAYPGARR
jgi:two-component sensor histidine kinase